MKKPIILIIAATIMSFFVLQAENFGSFEGRLVDDKGSAITGVTVKIKEAKRSAITNNNGYFKIDNIKPGKYTIEIYAVGYTPYKQKIDISAGKTLNLVIKLSASTAKPEEIQMAPQPLYDSSPKIMNSMGAGKGLKKSMSGYIMNMSPDAGYNTEEYDRIYDNAFRDAVSNPLSTFSIDVDAASYSNMRRFINGGSLPPKDAVRTEELINYFSYDYPQPRGNDPFSIYTEISKCPWNNKNLLVHIGLQGKKIDMKDIPASNLVFLLDVSGSMDNYNKLPLLKSAFRMLVDNLRPQDRVAIVVYAGAAGIVLPSTPASDKEKILEAIDNLQAGGSTAGGEGIMLAYKTASKNLIQGGNNRIILATDGDFNVGVSSDADLVRLIESKRNQGIFLTVLGFGMGNYKDSKMEKLADKGNGNYAYIDNMPEAKKVLVNEIGATLMTIAKDVKIQVEFNPAKVKSYRLIGYENRLLAKEDFDNDKKDAGELGAGHTVTALYEIVPAEAASDTPVDENLRYQSTTVKPDAYNSDEILTVKFRYKYPDGNKSKLIEMPVKETIQDMANTSDNFRFSAAVAAFAMLLRDSEYKGTADYDYVIKTAKNALGQDTYGYRAEFIKLAEAGKLLDKTISNK